MPPGHTNAISPGPGRPKDTYIREDQILPHLAALAIRPDEAAALIGQVRTAGITLAYDPDTRTIRTGDITAVTVGLDR